ncbi:DUF4623 domain-containing protein [Dysgonomonas sp. 511]|uniref:DUF4623 domain-containing protein n=1 Tax=Dysgonomonas sp. 511 TaxID=2302930 RepID=UPI0013D88CEA|nr:DUF4623 domain-containing protein [Dysgonomonas sp. 511]NDV78111.1 DUF4623 domain-containing protein [Dysgonomonas sp. 511]
MKNFNFKIVGLALLFTILFACNDNFEPRFERLTVISELIIANGGIDGKTAITGTYVPEGNIFVFDNVPAETDLQNIKFTGSIALGAAPEFETYDFFSTNPQEIKIINREVSSTYNVKFNILPPAMDPAINRVVVTLEDGVTEVIGEVDKTAKILYLDAKNGEYVFLKSIETLPKHALCEFTAIQGSKIYQADPGKIKLDHMGRTDEYTIEFIYIPPVGVDFDKKIIYDYTKSNSLVSFGQYPAGSGGAIRGGDFDGTETFISNRGAAEGVTNFKLEDIIAGDISKVVLAKEPVGGYGYFGSSQTALSGGNYYAINMPTPGTGVLNVHHWSSISVAPTLTSIPLSDTESAGTARYGDNMSIQLDENGNGYMFSINNVQNKLMRIRINNYIVSATDLAFVAIPGGSQGGYANFNPVRIHDAEIGSGDANEYTYVTSGGLQLFDRNGAILSTVGLGKLPANLYNARIAVYNKGRYMVVLTKEAKMYIYDISEGDTTVDALAKFNATSPAPLFEYSLGAFSGYGSIVATGIKNDVLYVMVGSGNIGSVIVGLPKKTDD